MQKRMIQLLATVLLCGTAHAAVVYFDYTGSPVEAFAHADGNSGSWISSYLKLTVAGALAGLETDDPRLSAYSYGSGSTLYTYADVSANNNLTTSFLNLSDTVGASSGWGVDFEGGSIAFALIFGGGDYQSDSSGDLYVGFRLNQGGEDFYYGWAQIYGTAIADGPENSADAVVGVKKMAFNNTLNEDIAVGVIPEPATALSLAMGGLVIAVYRRIRKAYGC
jgi:hypothetical protein